MSSMRTCRRCGTLPMMTLRNTPTKNGMLCTLRSAGAGASSSFATDRERAVPRSFHPLKRRRSRSSIGSRSFGTTTSSTADGTRVFFEWLEKSYGARFGGTPLPMDDDRGSDSNSSNENTSSSSSSSKSAVVSKDSLELEDLQKLLRHEISVLVVRNFYPTHASASLGRELAREGNNSKKAQNWKVSTSRGLESSDVATVGRHAPYNIALSNQGTDEYFREVRNELRDRRGLALTAEDDDNEFDNNNNNNNNTTQPPPPTLWPLDLLRLELDELWPNGAGLARANHQASHRDCMGGGLPRLMVGPTRWKKGLVHVDELAPLEDTKGCFSANIYLQLPYNYEEEDSHDSDANANANTTPNTENSSGERKQQPVMEVWPLGIRSKWDWYRNAPTLSHLASQDPEGQVILRKALGDHHKLQISAAPGDLVLLCVQRPHCAVGFGHDETNNGNGNTNNGTPPRRLQTRVSLQCFLQYTGDNERLTIDS